jgi:CspA family cold shock protein
MSELRLPFRGRVKNWKPERGFGFIAADDGRQIFIPKSALRGAGLTSLEAGERVAFDVDLDRSGRERVSKIELEQPPPD